MKVLMFGWEFPPHLSGGLGTACYGLTKALVGRGTEIVFVLPRLGSDSLSLPGRLRLRSASGVAIQSENVKTLRHAGRVLEGISHGEALNAFHTVWEQRLRTVFVDSGLFAYATNESYNRQLKQAMSLRTVSDQGEAAGVLSHLAETSADSTCLHKTGQTEVIQLHGGYGKDLMSEVYKYSLAAQSIAARNSFDVIHAHDWMAYPAGILAKKISGKPLVCHVHATEADRSGTNMNSAIAHIEWEGMHAADKVVAVSHFTKNLIMRVYNVPESKIEVVHNAVSRKDARHIYHTANPKGEKQVLFMGRVTFQKGPDYFVEAARLVLQTMPNVRFVMAGAGDMLLSMVSRVAKYRIGRRFTFTGFLKGDEVERMYAASDLYVMPSVSEPFGIAPLEAMVYDVPVLMSKQSGVSEVVTNALKVDFWDVRKMADRICAVLAYPALGQFMVKNCQEELKSIRWDNAAIKLNRIYADLARGN